MKQSKSFHLLSLMNGVILIIIGCLTFNHSIPSIILAMFFIIVGAITVITTFVQLSKHRSK
ncbi:hypothetical protein J3T65_11805 [Staphylococcus simiae]|uniref:hypothetical protein n=1 Tax=Staphylococcus simiae TaxID=308354 RepID=UPI001A9921C5|nr:hypothetical protein [Staphylococcus simiae]MBO1202291.1 hypothetical protein [Staphylococcus simiae]MBO1204551.1 hypothetical protein [Staphylococcus simiae]MBO1211801.1 hypothetical protein [Staphylococcus simiae]MBO1230718.1 hypothetical protein [Staphylococcus simiae]